VNARSTLESTSPKARSRSREVVPLDEAPKISPRGKEKFIIRGEKDDYDSENSWISDGLPSSSRRRRRGDGRWEGGEWREK